MIIQYDTRPDASTDQKLQSLIESIQLALNNIDAGRLSGTVNNTVKIDGGNLSGTIDGNYLFVKNLDADSITAVEGWIDKLLVQTHLLANEGEVFELDAIEVNASKIKTGTLDVERLIYTNQTTGEKYLVHFNPDGSTAYEKLDGNVIEDLTITADKIVSGSIMTRHITTQNIEGTSGWINLRNGTFFYGNGASFATATNAISWNGSKLQIKADEFLLSSGKTIQEEIEAVENWFYSVPPTTSNEPAVNWTTTNLKERHLRDIYFDTTTGKSYRWSKDGNVYSWVEIQDVQLSALQGRVATAETQISQNSQAITLKANASDVYNKTSTDALLEVKANKDTLTSEINASADTVKIQASKVEIDGTAIFNAIKPSADAAYDAKGAAQTAVDGIEVGGRNLLLKTATPATGTMASDTNAQLNPYNMVKSYSELGLTTDDYVTVSFDYSYTNGKAGGSIKVGTNAAPWEYFGTLITTTAGSNSGHIESSFKVTSALAASTGNNLRIRTDNCNGMTLTVSNAKLEKGNKATDWSPAPEDVQAEIDAVDTKADGANSQEQRIYYRSNSTTAPTAPSTWVTSTSTANATWSTKRMQYDSTYKYLYTCIQRKTVGGTITNSTVLLDDTTTVIDGGNIITGTVKANAVDASSGTFNTANIPNLSAAKITSGTLDAARIGANSIAIGKLDSSTQTKVNNGDSALSKVNYYNRTCLVGNSTNTQTKYWRKFASYAETRAYADPFIIFDVMTSGDFGSGKRFGRLKAHVRTSSTGKYQDAKLEWISRGEGIVLTDFVLAYKETSGTDVKVELWCRCPRSYDGYRFNMVQEGDRTSASTSAMWTLHGSWTADGVQSITSGYTQVTSTDIDAARTTATSYITDIDSNNGITIKAVNGATSGSDAAKQNYIKLNASGLDIYQGGDSVALYGATQRIGKSAAQHIELDDDSFEWHDGTNGAFFSIEGSIDSSGSSVSLHSPTIWTYATHDEPSAGITMSHRGDYGVMNISASCKADSDTDAQICIGANKYVTSHGEGEGNSLCLTPYNLEYRSFGGLSTYFNINGSKITAKDRTLSTLWSGANMLGAGSVVNLSERISDQLNGIVLVWSAYSSGAARDYAWVYHFIPKHGATGNQSTTVFMANGDFSEIGAKFLFIYDSHIDGYSSNKATGTRNGITYDNAYWVLRYVYGV